MELSIEWKPIYTKKLKVMWEVTTKLFDQVYALRCMGCGRGVHWDYNLAKRNGEKFVQCPNCGATGTVEGLPLP